MSEQPPSRHRPRPVVDASAMHPRTSSARRADPFLAARLLHTGAAPLTDDETAALADLLDSTIEILRAVARAAGVDPAATERALASMLSFLTRRVTGDYEIDEFGMDPDFLEHVYLPFVRPLYRYWFRVDVRGIENIPREGGALIVANHSGTIALDAIMVLVALADETPDHRHLRLLGADLVFGTPYVGEIARRVGATLASTADAERLLTSGHIVGVWPEGFKGVGKPFSERYRLQRFGRGGFVSSAIGAGVPIIPCSIVGAEETYPMLGNAPLVAKLLGLPYFALTPTFPWLGPLGLIPLPSKWTIEFGEPIATDEMEPALAEDPMTVLDVTDTVRETIQQTLYRMLMERGSVFRG